MWPFNKKKKQGTNQPSTDSVTTSDDSDISCFARGLGNLIDSTESQLKHSNGSDYSCFFYEKEDFRIFLTVKRRSDRNTREIWTSPRRNLSIKEQDFLFEKMVKRFPKNIISEQEREEQELKDKFERISLIGCPKDKS